MKKTYIIPALMATEVAQCLPIAASEPNVGVGSGEVDAPNVDVKGNKNYDVWDEDWSR